MVERKHVKIACAAVATAAVAIAVGVSLGGTKSSKKTSAASSLATRGAGDWAGPYDCVDEFGYTVYGGKVSFPSRGI